MVSGPKIAIYGASFTVVMTVVLRVGFPIYLNYQLVNAKALVPGGEGRAMWEKLDFPLKFSVFIFNVTNYIDVENERAKPKLKEIGPYVYDEWKRKVNVTDYPENDTVSFNMMNTWVFDKKSSKPLTGNEVVVIPNPLLVGMLGYAERKKPGALKLIKKAIPSLFEEQESIFLKTTVNDLLFNGVVVNCTSKDFSAKAVCSELKKSDELEHVSDTIHKFSVFGMRNGTPDKLQFLVSRGLEDYTTLGKVMKLNGKEKLPYWGEDPCNDLEGTDSTIFPPFFSPEMDVVSYSPDLCRSLGAKFVELSKYEKIYTLRYNASFGDQSASDSCFCYKERPCLKKGLMDLFNCTGTPLIASLPHFYDSDEDYVTAVEGLHPVEKDHSIIIEIEPLSGSPIYAKKRVQLSLPIHPFNNVLITETLPDVILPFIWIEESLELSHELVRKLNVELISPVRLADIGFVVCTVAGCLSTAFGIGLYFKQKNKKPVSPANQKVEPPAEFIGSNKGTDYPAYTNDGYM